MISGAEAATVAKAGASVAQGLKTSVGRSKIEWPNTLEALVELCAIVHDWCEAATYTNDAIGGALEARRQGINFAMPYHVSDFLQTKPGIRFILPGYIERVSYDIDRVLGVPAPWRYRMWRYSRREARKRRTLRSMLLVYCPELLGSFQQAVTNRADLIDECRQGFAARLEDPQTPEEVLRDLNEQFEETFNDLLAARDSLRDFILANYPLPSAN